jgi:hypothetical protein
MPDNGYVDDEHDLRVDSDTEPDEVLDFVETRTKNPIVVEDTTVFNYGTHRIDEQRLRERIPSLFRDSYVIPFQLGPVWAFMLYHLPPEVRTLEYLIYDTDDGQYHPHRNFMRLAEEDNVDAVEEDLSEWVQDNTDFNDQFQFSAQASGLDAYL